MHCLKHIECEINMEGIKITFPVRTIPGSQFQLKKPGIFIKEVNKT